MTGKAGPCWGAADLVPGRLRLCSTDEGTQGRNRLSPGQQLEAEQKDGSDLPGLIVPEPLAVPQY